jgi:hypothetical protein
VDTVGSVTSPVTQVEVVAVKSASRYGTATPSAELIGNTNNALPTRMVTKKLSNMVCVVESVNFFFLTIRFSSRKHNGTNVLCSQLVPFIMIRFCNYITFFRACQYIFTPFRELVAVCMHRAFSILPFSFTHKKYAPAKESNFLGCISKTND